MKNILKKSRLALGILMLTMLTISAPVMADTCGFWFQAAQRSCANYFAFYDMYNANPSVDNYNRMRFECQRMEMYERTYADCMEEN